mgnify:CR=1 FL=1
MSNEEIKEHAEAAKEHFANLDVEIKKMNSVREFLIEKVSRTGGHGSGGRRIAGGGNSRCCRFFSLGFMLQVTEVE